MLIDAFMFNDEFELLEFRLSYLDPVVDRFVIAESRQAHSGLPKPLHLAANFGRFRSYAHKIELITYSMPEDASRFVRERAARDALLDPLRGLDPDCRVLICDLDEIPSRQQCVAGRDAQTSLSVPMHTYFRRANWEVRYENPLLKAKVMSVRDLPETLAEFREEELACVGGEAGGHFSYLGFNAERLAKKYSEFSHGELDFTQASDVRLLALADALAIDHLGRTRWQGGGLFAVQADPALWTDVQRNMHEFDSTWFDEESVARPTLRRRLCASLIDRVLAAPTSAWALLLPESPSDPFRSFSRRDLIRLGAATLSDTVHRLVYELRLRIHALRTGHAR